MGGGGGIWHFIESKHKFQDISKHFFHPLFLGKITFITLALVPTITQPTKMLSSRYTAGFTNDNNSR